MFDKDNTLLGEAYIRMKTIVTEDKALTPEQIAGNAQAAGGKKSEGLPKNKTEDKATLKTLEEVPYTDQNADNFTQDGVDKKVKDRYTLKEGDEAAAVDAFYNGKKKKVVKEEHEDDGSGYRSKEDKDLNELENAQDTAKEVYRNAKPSEGQVDPKASFTRSAEHQQNLDALFTEITEDLVKALKIIDSELKEIGGDTLYPSMRREAGMLISRIVDDFKRGKLPDDAPDSGAE